MALEINSIVFMVIIIVGSLWKRYTGKKVESLDGIDGFIKGVDDVDGKTIAKWTKQK